MPIIIDVTPLLKNVGMTMRIDESEVVSYPEDSLILTSPVRVTGDLVNTGNAILLKGAVSSTIKLNCSRCVKEFDYPARFDIEEEFEAQPDNTIDISEAIRQDLITGIPIQPLCSKMCKGGS